mmetsp:Transcript_61362/g.142810  ORF Transcript_61362/g.142810 Transcript_61362/m.142810 type:complete len:327 (+) Transcript_61362:53-1033(+)
MASHVVLKCTLPDAKDVMRLRVERPLRIARVRELICQAVGTSVVVKYSDAKGDLRELSSQSLKQLEKLQGKQPNPVLRLHLCTSGPATSKAAVGAAPPPSPASAKSDAEPLPAAAASANCDAEPPPAGVAGNSAAKASQSRMPTRSDADPLQATAGGSSAAKAQAQAPSVEAVRACDLQDGMRLWIESGTTKRCLQASADGHVDFDGGLEVSAQFVVRQPYAGPDEIAVSLEGPGLRYLRCGRGGALDLSGCSAQDPGCRFSVVDVVDGIVLLLGPPGTGHVRAAPGVESPRTTRVEAPEGFKLLAISDDREGEGGDTRQACDGAG